MPALYDDIGTRYRTTRRSDPGIARTLAGHLRLQRDGRYLDVACGTGNYTCALAGLGGRWCGIDASEVMLGQAKRRTDRITWTLASAECLPFSDQSFDGALCTLAIHHFAQPARAFAETRRVLKEGRLVIFTGTAEQMRGYWLNHYFPEMMARSIAQMPGRALIADALRSAGFREVEFFPYFVDEDLQDLFLYAGKQRPSLYLSEEVRANISSFARLCEPEELAAGLTRLEADLRTGAFMAVRAAYATTDGDYCYVVASDG